MKPTIKTPCSEDWNKMKIGVNSRFCDSCSKDVIDFTKKTREEIFEYLILKSNERTCGHFYRHQLDYTSTDFTATVRAIASKQKDPRISLKVLILGSALAISCQSPDANTNTTNAINTTQDTIELVEPIIVNTPIVAEDDTSKEKTSHHLKPSKDTIQSIDPDTIRYIEMIEGEVLLGDVDIIDPGEDTQMIGAPTIEEPVYTEPERQHYSLVEIKPEFPGGIDSLRSYINKNIVYPQIAKDMEMQGKVYVEFIIDKTGNIIEPRVVRGVSKELDSAAIDVVKQMPQWTPGKVRGKEVEVIFIVPVSFRL